MIYSIAIAVYVVLYTGIALFLRSYILYRNTGINPFKRMGDDGVKGFNERVLMLGATCVPIIAVVYFLPEPAYSYLVPITHLEINWLKNLGVFLIIFGSAICIIAQFQMGDSWRIGINENEKTTLITAGFYRYSRNPIYLGLLISFFGFFFVAPNAMSLCCLALSYPSVEIKIRFEELYLLDKHGASFKKYMGDVRRWI